MKYLAVDIGNVLVNINFDNFIKKLSMSLNISKSDCWAFIDRTQQLHDLGYTLLTNELRDHFKIHSEETISIIMEEWNNTLTPNSTVIEWVEKLINNGTKVALLSNMGYEHKSIMKNILGSKIFDNSIKYFSCDAGTRKPTLLFYHLFLSLHEEFKGATYLDDRPENIETSRYFGFDAHKFDVSQLSSNDIGAKLKSLEE